MVCRMRLVGLSLFPVALLACINETRMVSSVSAFKTLAKLKRPSLSGRKEVILNQYAQDIYKYLIPTCVRLLT